MVISFKYILKFKGRGGGQDSAKEGRGPPPNDTLIVYKNTNKLAN